MLFVELRLVGNGGNEGRLEIRYGEVWGTVCDDYFNKNAADVACAVLGFQ